MLTGARIALSASFRRKYFPCLVYRHTNSATSGVSANVRNQVYASLPKHYGYVDRYGFRNNRDGEI
jgi:hypothetical protein